MDINETNKATRLRKGRWPKSQKNRKRRRREIKRLIELAKDYDRRDGLHRQPSDVRRIDPQTGRVIEIIPACGKPPRLDSKQFIANHIRFVKETAERERPKQWNTSASMGLSNRDVPPERRKMPAGYWESIIRYRTNRNPHCPF